jgi:anti-sigma factor ChrR (cupin superfamily)
MDTHLNADFTVPVAIDTNAMAWVPSPSPGVDRRMLDRIGDEVAIATSIVRYAPGGSFSPHRHDLGEEFLVLSGVFSDEHGDYPAGTYVRNPPGSAHAPRTAGGCVIFVKLRQMAATDSAHVVLRSEGAVSEPIDDRGAQRTLLHACPHAREVVAIESLPPGYAGPLEACERGEEILVLGGELRDDRGVYDPGFWIRRPAGISRRLSSGPGARYWVKRGRIAQPL